MSFALWQVAIIALIALNVGFVAGAWWCASHGLDTNDAKQQRAAAALRKVRQ